MQLDGRWKARSLKSNDDRLGPFARIRPGTTLADHVIIGSYVEVKNSDIAADAKVPHLSYVGDAEHRQRT